MVEIGNVRRATRRLHSLMNRVVSESVGIGLFYGLPGLGKTRWGLTMASLLKQKYIRLLENMTVKDFLRELLWKLKYSRKRRDSIQGTQNELYYEILDYLHEHPNTLIFVDECDYGFSKPRIMATIRDLADQSVATFALIGMENAKKSLQKMNAHYFDRCNSFCEFTPVSQQDVVLLASDVCDVELDKPLLECIWKKSSGTMRLLEKHFERLEAYAKEHKLSKLTLEGVSKLMEATL